MAETRFKEKNNIYIYIYIYLIVTEIVLTNP
jgi:hypothetical protein